MNSFSSEKQMSLKAVPCPEEKKIERVIILVISNGNNEY